jgi:hypothetical protein
MPTAPGAGPQVIMPPGKVMPAIQLAVIPTHPEPAPPPPATPEPQDNQPVGDPDSENPPDKQ